MEVVIARMPDYAAGSLRPVIHMMTERIAGSHSNMAVRVYGENQAGAILEKRIYSFRRGEAGLIGQLNACRICNDVRAGHIETLLWSNFNAPAL
jgi:hypothetical protein